MLLKLFHGLTFNLFKQRPQPYSEEPPVTGKYYTRTGYCNGCGHCCQNIALIFENEVVKTVAAFQALKDAHPEYEAFRVSFANDEGLLFHCSHLLPDNRCGIYNDRPGFCRNYPSEQGLILGGRLPEECSYRFTPRRSFSSTLEALQ